MPRRPDDSFFKTILDNAYDGIYFVDSERLITYWNKGAERLTGYKAEEVVGRPCSDNILVHVDEQGCDLCQVESCPAMQAMRSGEVREAEVYLHHKDGHRVPIVTRITPIREDGAVVGAVEIFSDNSRQLAVRQQVDELERLSLLDQLTDLGNRRHAEIHLSASLNELRRYGWPFGLLYFDIDHFKLVNDTYGHDAGDRVLKAVSHTALNSVRSFDTVSRWGGEEFTAIIENVDRDELSRVAEKLRRLVEGSPVQVDGVSVKVTISIGATFATGEDTVESVVKRADSLMYRSKQEGRNRVTVD